MRYFILTAIFTLSLALNAQVITIKGRILVNGLPLKNTPFKVVNRNIECKTDDLGYFVLSNITEDDILFIPALGYRSLSELEEIEKISSVIPYPKISPLLEHSKDTVGVTYMSGGVYSENTGYTNQSIRTIDDIKHIQKTDSNLFKVKRNNRRYYYSGFKLNYSTTIDFATVGSLPELTSVYAENKDKTYDPADFFRTGVSFGNALNIMFPGIGGGTSSLSLGQKKSNSPIPNAYKEAYNVSFLSDKITTGRFESATGILYASSYSRLNRQGGNLSNLLYSVLTNPPASDPSNPSVLVNHLPDRNKTENIIAYAKTGYDYEELTANASVSFEKQWDKLHNRYTDSVQQRNMFRDEHLSNVAATTYFKYKIHDYDPDVDISVLYGFKRTTDKLVHENTFNRSGTEIPDMLNNRLHRNAHDLKYGAGIYTDEWNVEIFNKHYFSNTVTSGSYINLFPEVGFTWNMENFIEDVFYYYDKRFYLYASMTRSIGEPDLVYKNPAALSTPFDASGFRSFYEYTTLFDYKGLRPETYLKNELGLRYNSYNSNFSGEVNGFFYTTQNFISPSFEPSSGLRLNNLGRLNNYGYYLAATYDNHRNSYREPVFNIQLNFSRTWNKVTHLYGDEPFVRLAGFRDIATVFAKGESVGAIYGSTYQRDEKGQLIPGADGFPLVDAELKKNRRSHPGFYPYPGAGFPV